MSTLIISTLILFCLSQVTEELVYNRMLLTDSEALCLDGSPGIHYISKGDPDKILLYFYGGGWCGETTLSATLESCYQRSKTNLGSSKAYGPTLDVNMGIISGNDDNYFKNWTKALLIYCDGSGHQGYRKQPVSYKGQKLYFRGQKIVRNHFQSLEKSIGLLTKVNNIVISGASAGGLAVFLWTNFIRDHAKAKNIWSLPDSGFFLNEKDSQGIASYQLQFINLMKYSNAQVPPPPVECVQKHKNELHKCMFAENIYSTIKIPQFNIISQYDLWSITYILRINCAAPGTLTGCNKKQTQRIQDYHQKTKKLLQLASARPNGGAWAPVCINHCYIHANNYNNPNYRIPANSIYSPNQSIKRWIQKAEDEFAYKHIDKGQWPGNKPCSKVAYQVWQNPDIMLNPLKSLTQPEFIQIV